MKFVKKPVEVEATQWFKNGDHPEDYSVTYAECEDASALGDSHRFPEFRKRNNYEGDVVRYHRIGRFGNEICPECKHSYNFHGWIDTMDKIDGGHVVCVGDWIITDAKGDYYPCKPAVFELTYEKAAPEIVDPIAELKALAEAGDSDAQVKMGKAYHKDEEDVEGVKKDCSEAIRWWKKAGEQGNTEAQNLLAVAYHYGCGDSLAVDKAESMRWYQKSALLGDAQAQLMVGFAHHSGYGAEKNQELGVMWYKKSAKQGNTQAQEALAEAYYFGEGVKKNARLSKKWQSLADGRESSATEKVSFFSRYETKIEGRDDRSLET